VRTGAILVLKKGPTLHYIALNYVTLHYITLHYITLGYDTLHCISYTFHWSTSSPYGSGCETCHVS